MEEPKLNGKTKSSNQFIKTPGKSFTKTVKEEFGLSSIIKRAAPSEEGPQDKFLTKPKEK